MLYVFQNKMMFYFFSLCIFLSCFMEVKAKPNIVYVLLDDIGVTDMFNNESVVPTPFLNSLLKEGVHFRNHYVAPTCTPSRASLLSGRYQANTGLTWAFFPGSPSGLPQDIPTLPEILRQHGYNTAMSGKWHLGNSQWKQTPAGRGFNIHVGCYTWDMDYHTKKVYYAPWEPLATDWIKAFSNGTFEHYNEEIHSTDAITIAAEDMIRDHVAGSESGSEADITPLYLYVAYTAGHSPLQPLPKDEEICSHIKHTWRRQFCGLLVGVDRNMKHLYSTVKEQLGEDTIMVIASDNGGSPWFGGMNAPYRGTKTTPLQGGVLVPALAVDMTHNQQYFGKSNQVERKFDEMMHISDWFPTFLSYANITKDNFRSDSQPPEGVYTSSSHHIHKNIFNVKILDEFDGIDMSDSIRYSGMNIDMMNELELTELDRSPRNEMLLDMYYAQETCFGEQAMEAYIYKDMKFIHGELPDSMWYLESKVNYKENYMNKTSNSGYMNIILPHSSVGHSHTLENGHVVNNEQRTLHHWLLEQYARFVMIFLENVIYVMESIFGIGECDSTRIFLTHALILPHLESILQNPPKHPLPQQLEHRYAHFQETSGTCSTTDMNRNISLDKEYGRMYYLFNLTADPYEMHNLDIADYPEIISYIQGKLVDLRKKRPVQQTFWMQLHNKKEWPKTFISGGRYNHFDRPVSHLPHPHALNRARNSNTLMNKLNRLMNIFFNQFLNNNSSKDISNSDDSNSGLLFIHPWYDDDVDPWADETLINGKAAADEKLHDLIIKLIGVHIILFGILEYIISTIVKQFR